jgi:hypothetical protein
MNRNFDSNDDSFLINNYINDTNTNSYIFNKTLVLYTFHEDNYNVRFFIKNGIFKSPYVDFILICNNKTLKVNCPDYVKYINRPNIGYDFGGWSEGLLRNDLYKNYYYFIFANSSVIGPILPLYNTKIWTDIYLEGLNKDVKLFGSSINTCVNNLHVKINTNREINSHVQSYIYSMNIETLEFLIQKEIFSLTNIYSDYTLTILNKEIHMSYLILQNNWNIGCLIPYYKNVDFRKTSNFDKEYLDDIVGYNCYNIIWNEYDIVFIKANRNINYSNYLRFKT